MTYDIYNEYCHSLITSMLQRRHEQQQQEELYDDEDTTGSTKNNNNNEVTNDNIIISIIDDNAHIHSNNFSNNTDNEYSTIPPLRRFPREVTRSIVASNNITLSSPTKTKTRTTRKLKKASTFPISTVPITTRTKLCNQRLVVQQQEEQVNELRSLVPPFLLPIHPRSGSDSYSTSKNISLYTLGNDLQKTRINTSNLLLDNHYYTTTTKDNDDNDNWIVQIPQKIVVSSHHDDDNDGNDNWDSTTTTSTILSTVPLDQWYRHDVIKNSHNHRVDIPPRKPQRMISS
jgi:hypothetical protein